MDRMAMMEIDDGCTEVGERYADSHTLFVLDSSMYSLFKKDLLSKDPEPLPQKIEMRKIMLTMTFSDNMVATARVRTTVL